MAASIIAVAALLPAALAAPSGDLAVKNVFDPEYYAREWTGTCATGKMQTPIDLPVAETLPGVPDDLVTDVKMPVVNAPVIKNVGSAMQITWDPMSAFNMSDDSMFPMVAAGGDSISDVILKDVPVEFMLKMIPLQVHWHETSEHSVGGLLAPMESHIVTAVAKGEAPKDWGCDAVWDGGEANLEKCIAVFGTIYIMSDTSKSPVYLDYLLENFPQIAGSEAPFPTKTFDLMDILPEDKSYDSYIGSLTTPPCAEGLRWHVFTNYATVSIETVAQFEEIMANITDIETGEKQLYRHNNRPIQHLNGRTIYHHKDTSATKESGSGSNNDSEGGRSRRPRDEESERLGAPLRRDEER